MRRLGQLSVRASPDLRRVKQIVDQIILRKGWPTDSIDLTANTQYDISEMDRGILSVTNSSGSQKVLLLTALDTFPLGGELVVDKPVPTDDGVAIQLGLPIGHNYTDGVGSIPIGGVGSTGCAWIKKVAATRWHYTKK